MAMYSPHEDIAIIAFGLTHFVMATNCADVLIVTLALSQKILPNTNLMTINRLPLP